ncbi:hypothetical protein ACFYWY_27615 [Streptomyces sp. NPDC002870]|uniref:hypothetical protein n=1 Tax=Streptomyces sp. NPDC002870 TaxID=3364666 RepID=UPI003696F934
MQAFVDHFGDIEGNQRLLTARPGSRMMQEAMGSGQEFLDESLLDEIVISLEARAAILVGSFR